MDDYGIDISSGRVMPESTAVSLDNDTFTEWEEVPSVGYNRLVRAMRYGKHFILKGLKPEYRDDEVYRSLLRKEFEIMVQLTHPNIVRVYTLEEVEGVGFCIVMEWVDGMSLDEWLSVRKPSAATRKRVVGQLLDAMQHWHTCQIVHRDLKPSNILVTCNGDNVRVIDFGLADADQYAVLKEPAYTLSYASPEQIQGGPLDCRSDIYSFGRLLRRLFPHRYRLVAARCCRHRREQRYASAEAVRRAFVNRRVLSLLVSVLVLIVLILLGNRALHYNSDVFSYTVIDNQVLRVKIVDSEAVIVGVDTLVGDLVLPESVRHGLFRYPLRTIGDDAFSNCKHLTRIKFPASLRSIGDRAFTGCTALTDTLVLPEGLTYIGDHVFDNCESVKACRVESRRLHLKPNPANEGRFGNMVDMHTLIVDGAVDSLCEYLFRWAYWGVHHIELEEGLTHLGEGSFSELYYLETIHFPTTLRRLDVSCFYGCGIQRLVLPEGLEEIDDFALAILFKCHYLEVGPNVRRIGSNAFYDCRVMDTIRFRSAEPPVVEKTFMGTRGDGRYPVILVPAASLDRYLADSNFAKLSPVGY